MITERGDQKTRVQSGDRNSNQIAECLISSQHAGATDVIAGGLTAADHHKDCVIRCQPLEYLRVFQKSILIATNNRAADRQDECHACSNRVSEIIFIDCSLTSSMMVSNV